MGRVYLIGMRACGKTTIGAMLAEKMACDFLDLDQELCASEGRTVEDIVAAEGWEGFRKRESDFLAMISPKYGNAVLATGGGLITVEKNRRYLRDNGLVFWLKADAALLRDRLAKNPLVSQRPSLTQKGVLDEVDQILKERAHLYEECSHHAIDAGLEPETICLEIMERLGKA